MKARYGDKGRAFGQLQHESDNFFLHIKLKLKLKLPNPSLAFRN